MKQQSRDLVGQDAVDLLGHRAVEAAQPGLDVGDRDAELAAASAAASVEFTSPGTTTSVRPLVDSTRLDALRAPRAVCARVRARADAEQWSGSGDAELVEEHPDISWS